MKTKKETCIERRDRLTKLLIKNQKLNLKDVLGDAVYKLLFMIDFDKLPDFKCSDDFLMFKTIPFRDHENSFVYAVGVFGQYEEYMDAEYALKEIKEEFKGMHCLQESISDCKTVEEVFDIVNDYWANCDDIYLLRDVLGGQDYIPYCRKVPLAEIMCEAVINLLDCIGEFYNCSPYFSGEKEKKTHLIDFDRIEKRVKELEALKLYR